MVGTKYVITGGPGCGKTTLLNKLEQRGFPIVPEAAREIIEERGKKYDGMQYDIYDRQIANEAKLGSKVGFLDRSLVDGVGYVELFGDELNRDWKKDILAANYTTAFILDPLPEEFYVQDSARNETYDEAVTIHTKLLQTYRRLGFEVIQIPATTPDDRLNRVLAELSRVENREHELKFRHVDGLEDKLSYFEFEPSIVIKEENVVCTLENGYERLRFETSAERGDMFYFTRKIGKGMTRVEEEEVLTQRKFDTRLANFDSDFAYSKIRETYVPFGDKGTTICFDDVDTSIAYLGKFVEIESATPRGVKIWTSRLGLREPILESYVDMADQAAHWDEIDMK